IVIPALQNLVPVHDAGDTFKVSGDVDAHRVSCFSSLSRMIGAAKTLGGIDAGFEQFIERRAGIGQEDTAYLSRERPRRRIYAPIAKVNIITGGALPYILLLDAEAEREAVDETPGQRRSVEVKALSDKCSERLFLPA